MDIPLGLNDWAITPAVVVQALYLMLVPNFHAPHNQDRLRSMTLFQGSVFYLKKKTDPYDTE